MKELEALEALRERDAEAYAHSLVALAAKHPSAALVRQEAAYALDDIGDEDLAIVHFDAAHELGLPDVHGPEFALRYGGILRSRGRFELALVILGEATIRFPDHAPLRTVLALTLHSAGHSDTAVATLLEVILQLGEGTDELDGYDQTIAALQAQLLPALEED